MKKALTVFVTALLCIATVFSLAACESGGKTVKEGDTLIVGVTDYAPMDYMEEGSDEWTGFDAELATAVLTGLGYKIQFKEIDWDTKIVTLNAGTIDIIWNGMTVNDELLSNLLLTTIYLKNQQVAVVKSENAASINKTADLKGKTVAVESGSAAQSAVGEDGITLRKLTNQNSAVLDVFSGTSDVAIVDFALAKSLLAEGSSYYGVLEMKDIGFEVENFSAAVRKSDSKLLWQINERLATLAADGTIAELAEKYGIANQLPSNWN